MRSLTFLLVLCCAVWFSLQVFVFFCSAQRHGFLKVATRNTSGRDVAVELLQYANSRQAIHFLRRLIETGSKEHPAITRLPGHIQDFLFSDDQALHALLQPKSSKSTYGQNEERLAAELRLLGRGGMCPEDLKLESHEFDRVAELLQVPEDGRDAWVSQQPDLARLDDEGCLFVTQYASLLLPGDDRRTETFWADRVKRGESYYDARHFRVPRARGQPQQEIESEFGVVRLEALFTLKP